MKTLDEWKSEINGLIATFSGEEANRLKKAVEFAENAHAGDFRKSTNEPYIVHPLEVCLVASTLTRDIDVLIAALFHDVVEDTDHTIEEIQEGFGDRVAGFVSDESEDKMGNIPKAISWMIRKEKFIEHLRTAPVESKTICISDKISNLRSSLYIYSQKGDSMWMTFNQKNPRKHAWYYRSIADAIWDNFEGTKAFDEYLELYGKLFKCRLSKSKSVDGRFSMVVSEHKNDNGTVYVEIGGRITSDNAEELFEQVDSIIKAHPDSEMIYDLDGLEMISSAGLRVFLKIKKAGVKFSLINASSDVYDVFDITGFVDILDIKKAYRKMDITGCNQIGAGAKGIVYKIDDETIIKVYKDPDCIDDIVKERECAKKALVMGVPTAIPFDIVLVGDRFGSVFELVNAKSLTKTILDDPLVMEETVKEYASVMKEMHSVIDNGEFGIKLPKIKDEIKVWAEFAKDYVSEDVYKGIIDFVDSISDTNNLLHGDGHPNNVMCTRDGQILIDMDTLCNGDPKADLAVIYAALVGYKIVDPENNFIPANLTVTQKIWETFINYYCEGESAEAIAEIETWCKKFAYLRLLRRGIRKEKNKPYFAENAKKQIEELFA